MVLKLRYKNTGIEVGCDEVGRGCIAGPVVAAAVILPPYCIDATIQDSKKLSAKKREYLADVIQSKAIQYAIASIDNTVIDKINILNASFLAMHKALDTLSTPFDRILVDGNRFAQYKNIEHICITKGDQKYMHIAAASILAKVYRDKWMTKQSQIYTGYQWEKNKGYPTPYHKKQVTTLGITPLHRKSFSINQRQLDLFPERI